MPISQHRFHEAARFVSKWRRPLILTHAKPDGDAIGSVAAVRRWLEKADARPMVALFDPVPPRFQILERALGVLHKDVREQELETCDGIIILDTCSFSQLEPLEPWLKSSRQPKLVVDHHRTRDAVADLELIDEPAAATCLILFDWARAVGWTLDEKTADALFVGIATDTGWFRHANTDTRALRAAADLIDAGAGAQQLHQAIYLSESPGRVRLLTAALNSLELSAAGRLAIMSLRERDFTHAGATLSDTEDIVNEPLRIASVVVSTLLVEQEESLIRVNFRSKPPHSPSVKNVDVSVIAAEFGGGGHSRAAGARIAQPLRHALASVTKRLLAELS